MRRRAYTKKLQRARARSGSGTCSVCLLKCLLVLHHIFGRKVVGWNSAWNEVWLCPNCHFSVHYGDLVVVQWVMTTEGRVLEWHRK